MAVKHHVDILPVAIFVIAVIALEIGWRKILLAYELALYAGRKSFIIKCKDVVGNNIRGECQMRLTEIHCTVISERYIPILCTIFRERAVNVPTEPVYGLPSCLQLHAKTVALARILVGGNHLTDFINLSGKHILVRIVHPVEISSCRELIALIFVSCLQVVQPLCLQMTYAVILIVVTGRLAVADGIADVELVMVEEGIRKSELRVEEVKVVMNDILLARIGIGIILRVLHAITDMAVLKVCIAIEALKEFPFYTTIDIEI